MFKFAISFNFFYFRRKLNEQLFRGRSLLKGTQTKYYKNKKI